MKILHYLADALRFKPRTRSFAAARNFDLISAVFNCRCPRRLATTFSPSTRSVTAGLPFSARLLAYLLIVRLLGMKIRGESRMYFRTTAKYSFLGNGDGLAGLFRFPRKYNFPR